MSESQLREAFTLMKQGDKAGATKKVEAILREDRSNANAWWLYSHLLDDEPKVVKSLEKVLALNPEHPGARKKLASLSPEYAHLAQKPNEDIERAKGEANTYWNQLDKAKQQPQKRGCMVLSIDVLIGAWNSMSFRTKLLLFVIFPFAFAGSILGTQEREATLPDIHGDTPQDVAARYYYALYVEDAEALYTYTCPERHWQTDEIVAEFVGFEPDKISVDFSQTLFTLFHYKEEDQAYVAMHGTMTMKYEGESHTIDWDLDAQERGYDGYGTFFKRVNGIWLVCEPYEVPNLEYEEN